MLGDISRVQKIYLVTGRTDMRKSFDGLMSIIRDTYQMDPYANAVYLFCGRKHNTLKALYFDKTGFVLVALAALNGFFDFMGWQECRVRPVRVQRRDYSEPRRELTRQELRWLLEGLSINQPKALKPSGKKDF